MCVWHRRLREVIEDSACGPQEQTQLWMSSPLTGQTSTAEARASVCLRGPNPRLHSRLMPFALFTLWSHVTCSVAEVKIRLPSPLSFCRCYRGLFVFRRPLFSSVASVSCCSTGGVTCLCVRLCPAVGQLNPLGPECSRAPVEPPEGSYCL